MVRAGAVREPSAWLGGAHRELCGIRRRYRIIQVHRLLQCLEFGEREAEFRDWYQATLRSLLAEEYLVREHFWSEAAAIGTAEWLKELAPGVRGARLEALPAMAGPAGALAEPQGLYALRMSDREQRHFWTVRQEEN